MDCVLFVGKSRLSCWTQGKRKNPYAEGLGERMKILINNLDYSAWLDAVHPLTVERKLNEPSTCRLWVSLPRGGMAAPQRNQALVVRGDDGTVFFTGYLAASPMPEYAGLGLEGPVYRWALDAVSDEMLLDSQMMTPSAGVAGVGAGWLMQSLVARTGPSALRTTGLTLSTQVGHFVPDAGAKWSHAAGAVATQARAAYRAVNGALSMTQLGSVVHVLDETNGSLQLANLSLTAGVARALANDVTVCGAEEPVAYLTEYLRGDGVTAIFPLSEVPYFGPSAGAKIIYEQFEGAEIDQRNWSFTGYDMYFSITGDGLTLNGGTGMDGEAALAWLDPVEAGGTLLLEATGVRLSPGSTGTLAGVYSGSVQSANCVAGFEVNSAIGTGVVSIAPLVDGVVAGPEYVLDSTKQYTLRARLHCVEMERFTQRYLVVGDSGMESYGGGGVVASAMVVLEVQEFAGGVAGMPVVLYDGSVAYAPGSYMVSPASSVNLIGSMRGVFLHKQGSGWVTSTVPGGGPKTRRVGTLAEAAECELQNAQILKFNPGFIPILGEVIAVNYRSVGRAVGRAVNGASQAALAAVGMPETAVWVGTVTNPAGRSSHDCRNAAQTLVTAASSLSASLNGSYKQLCAGWSTGLTQDVWPGDALRLTAPSLTLDAQVVVRQVKVEYAASVPDAVLYSIEFSNDWANDLSVKTSKRVPTDAWLPAVVSPTYLANLNRLVVVGMNSTAITVETNVTPPTGGGFEVRRRDFSFRVGQDVDLVIRSTVGTFDIPRATEADRFYMRMYDGAMPPNYSEFSVALFVNLPLGA